MTDNKTIILITPTHPRKDRMKYLERSIATFQKVRNLLWVVVEDGDCVDEDVRKILESSGIHYQYLNYGPTRHWGDEQRNAGLNYVKREKLRGIVYLADDDNFYDIRLFNELRKTVKVSIMPVGHLGPRGIERPIVVNGKIKKWDANWTDRAFPIDMAGFAFNASLLQAMNGTLFDFTGKGGETELLSKLVKSWNELEPLCCNCSRCYVWHNQPLGERPLWTYYRRLLLKAKIGSLKNLKKFFMFLSKKT
ncbi:MAG: hypothetical protein WCI77_02125 [Candidatus Omnitrophota bacterium]